MHYYLSLGANLGPKERTIERALQMIEQQAGKVLRCSSFYYSEPWGFDSPNTFCNLCCAVETTISPLEVLHTTQAIERALGRTHKSTAYATQASSTPRYADRTIDIDLIRAFDEHGQEVMCQIEDPDTPASKPLLVLSLPLLQ